MYLVNNKVGGPWSPAQLNFNNLAFCSRVNKTVNYDLCTQYVNTSIIASPAMQVKLFNCHWWQQTTNAQTSESWPWYAINLCGMQHIKEIFTRYSNWSTLICHDKCTRDYWECMVWTLTAIAPISLCASVLYVPFTLWLLSLTWRDSWCWDDGDRERHGLFITATTRTSFTAVCMDVWPVREDRGGWVKSMIKK